MMIFDLVNGKRSAKEIARKSGKSLIAVLQSLQKMRDLELIIYKKTDGGKIIKKNNSIIYEKVPLLKHLSKSYFRHPTKLPVSQENKMSKKGVRNIKGVSIPVEKEILDICNSGEDQLYEFKRAGVDMRILSKEICAFANTRLGGLIFYGVEDDGAIGNADMRRQVFDQRLQNSIRNNISPALAVKIIEKDVVGHKIFLICISPWNQSDVYQFDGRVYIKHGTNVFVAKPEELKKLHSGKYVV